jgi:predicted nucleic acid-binding protein
MPKSFVVVVDTSALVSGFLTAGPAKQVLELAEQGEFNLCLSDHIVAETSRSLRKPKLMAAYHVLQPRWRRVPIASSPAMPTY